MSVRTRVYSLTGSPNIMGCLMVLLAPLAAAVAYWAKKRWVKVLAMGCTGLMCLACLFTFSKGAWLGLIVAVVVFSLLLDKRLLALMGAVGAAALVLVPSVANRITYLFTADYAAASAGAAGRCAGPPAWSCCTTTTSGSGSAWAVWRRGGHAEPGAGNSDTSPTSIWTIIISRRWWRGGTWACSSSCCCSWA